MVLRLSKTARGLVASASLLATGNAGVASGATAGRARDAEYRAALDLVYDGAFAAAEERLAALARENPDDAFPPYLEALALCWRIEQAPERIALDASFRERVSRALALADRALGRDPHDLRARLARGAAHGVLSRYFLFRDQRRDAAREAVRMREDLGLARDGGSADSDVWFGLGLYDYYTDVLPRLFRLLRFVAGMPGGDRARGLAEIEQAREGSLFHEVEARVQLYEINAFLEGRPTRAVEELRVLKALYPGWPRWGLLLAEHLRDRLGLYAESALVSREVLSIALRHAHPNYQPVVASMARVSLGESLLLDLRLAEAREVLLPAESGSPEAAWVAGRAQLLVGRSLELEGNRGGALVHYRLATDSPDRALSRQARIALAAPMPADERRAVPSLAEARRAEERGDSSAARAALHRAFLTWPRSAEARLGEAEGLAGSLRLREARDLLEGLREGDPGPPSVPTRARLLRAEIRERQGETAAAVIVYKQVLQEPFDRADLRERASSGLRRVRARVSSCGSGEGSDKYSN